MPQFKTKTAHLVYALLNGEVITIMDGFKRFLVTNVPRECGRSIERKFGVEIAKIRKDFVSKTGQKGYYYEYRLNNTKYNQNGIKKMKQYVVENMLGANSKLL